MQITKAVEVVGKQDVIPPAKRDTAAQDTQKALAAAEGTAVSYMPSKEGLGMLQKLQNFSLLQGEKKDEDKQDTISDTTKAMKIARSIMAGKIVPAKDERFLQEHCEKLYRAAKNIASIKERGEKVDSELEDEDDYHLRKMIAGLKTTEGETASASGVSTESGSAGETAEQ